MNTCTHLAHQVQPARMPGPALQVLQGDQNPVFTIYDGVVGSFGFVNEVCPTHLVGIMSKYGIGDPATTALHSHGIWAMSSWIMGIVPDPDPQSDVAFVVFGRSPGSLEPLPLSLGLPEPAYAPRALELYTVDCELSAFRIMRHTDINELDGVAAHRFGGHDRFFVSRDAGEADPLFAEGWKHARAFDMRCLPESWGTPVLDAESNFYGMVVSIREDDQRSGITAVCLTPHELHDARERASKDIETTIRIYNPAGRG